MRVLVAPQEFKGSLTAEQAADALAAGIQAAQPGWTVDVVPLADGGPGFVDAMHRAGGGEIREAPASDALGRPVRARYLSQRNGERIVLESAQANGLMHISPGERDALRANTVGVGELLLAAVRPGTISLLVGVGGSATSDGGAGMALALGARLLDASGQLIGTGVSPLLALERVEWARPPALTTLREVVVGADVRNPLTGPGGAAAVYAPQKGAGPAEVALIDRALARYAGVLRASLGVDIEPMPGGGAAGGLAAGLVAFLGAQIVSGFDLVAGAADLEDKLAHSDIVITGEGSFDRQTGEGKGPGRLLDLASARGREAVVFAGRLVARPGPGVAAFGLTEFEPDQQLAMKNAAVLLREASRRWASTRGS